MPTCPHGNCLILCTSIRSEFKCIEIYFCNFDLKLRNRTFWVSFLFIPSHLLDLPHLLAGLPDPPDDSLTLWLASQALQLASQTSGWPLRPLTGLSDPLAGLSDPPHGLSDPQTNHLAGFGPSDPQTDFSDPQSGF